jgi:hypothetical protein
MRYEHGPLDSAQLWTVFSVAFIVLVALLLLAVTALR